jgi:hypothetical protein
MDSQTRLILFVRRSPPGLVRLLLIAVLIHLLGVALVVLGWLR